MHSYKDMLRKLNHYGNKVARFLIVNHFSFTIEWSSLQKVWNNKKRIFFLQLFYSRCCHLVINEFQINHKYDIPIRDQGKPKSSKLGFTFRTFTFKFQRTLLQCFQKCENRKQNALAQRQCDQIGQNFAVWLFFTEHFLHFCDQAISKHGLLYLFQQ